MPSILNQRPKEMYSFSNNIDYASVTQHQKDKYLRKKPVEPKKPLHIQEPERKKIPPVVFISLDMSDDKGQNDICESKFLSHKYLEENK
jgi:hypothetical protein